MDFETIITKIKTLALNAAKKEAEAAAALTEARQAKEDAVKRQKKAVEDGDRDAYIQATADLQNAATALDFAQLAYNANMKKAHIPADEANRLYGELRTAAEALYQAIADAEVKALEEARQRAVEAEKMTAAFADATGKINKMRNDPGDRTAAEFWPRTAACISKKISAQINAIKMTWD